MFDALVRAYGDYLNTRLRDNIKEAKAASDMNILVSLLSCQDEISNAKTMFEWIVNDCKEKERNKQ